MDFNAVATPFRSAMERVRLATTTTTTTGESTVDREMAIIREIYMDKADKWYYHLVRLYHPLEPWRQRWDFALILVLLFNVFVIPFRLGFEPDSQSISMDVLDLIIDIFFLADVAINFRTAYYEKARLVIDPKKISYKYLKGNFWLDLFTSLPYDAIVSAIGRC